MGFRRLLWRCGLLLLAGCCHPPAMPSDISLNYLPARVVDPDPVQTENATPSSANSRGKEAKAAQTGVLLGSPRSADEADSILPPRKGFKKPLQIPKGFPGSEAPPIAWPKTQEGRERALKELYPELPTLPPEVKVAPGPKGNPLTLSELQRIAAANNPAIRNAIAAVEAAKGAAIQATAYPNPTVAWEADTVGTTGAGYQGAYIDQLIKGGNDLRLKKAMALMDLRNTQLALRKAQTDLATQVRTSYFGVLVAAESLKVNRALARFTDNVYRVQVDLLAAGAAAPYEPMQLRPLALQARLNLLQAHNQYLAAWRQLVTALGLPYMPPTEIAGRVDMPVPVFDYDAVSSYVVNRHTDVLTAESNLQKGRYNVELNRVAPFPDFDVRALIQKDYTTPPFFLVYSAVVAMQIPVWDQNKGGVMQAKGQLTQAAQSVQQARLQLINTLADAYNRYATAREQVRVTMEQVRDQVRAYRGVYERHGLAPDEAAFGDVVTAQQTLATYVAAYVTALGLQWTAVVDVANLLQTDDLFQSGQTQEVVPIPDLDELLPDPCSLVQNRNRPAARAQAALSFDEVPAAAPRAVLGGLDEPTGPSAETDNSRSR